MMTTRELGESIATAMGKTAQIEGNGTASYELLMPYYLVYVAYEIYCKEIKPVPARGLARKWRNRWEEMQNLFARNYFSYLSPDMEDAIIERQEDLYAAITNDILVCEVAAMECCKDVPFEEQKILAASLLCNILAQIASIFWGKAFHEQKHLSYFYMGGYTYETKRRVPARNLYLETICHATFAYGNCVYSGHRHIMCDENKRMYDSVMVLQNHIVRWLFKAEINKS